MRPRRLLAPICAHLALASLLCAHLAVAAGHAAAQTPEQTATPEAAARLFLRSVRAIRFGATARLLHPPRWSASTGS